mmetsp:Transcript_124579/g.248562  ORF Transcript_124579/g.248562 Transcript_124579/m.248562 type:complete len:371 (-) Transcript_124579:143-1255(-)
MVTVGSLVPHAVACQLFATLFALRAWLIGARIGMLSIDLTRDGFDSFVTKNDRVLVDFYDRESTEWTKDKNELESAVRQVRNYGCKVPVAKVDSKVEGELAKKFVPRGNFPQLLWFTHGQPTKYHRTLRTAKSISDFVMALDREPVTAIKNAEEVKTFNRAILAELRKDSPLYSALEVVAQKHMDVLAVTWLDSPNNKISYYTEEGPGSVFTGGPTLKEFDAWVNSFMFKTEPIPEGHPLYDEGSLVVVGTTFEELLLRPDRDVMLLVYAPWCGFSKKFFSVWEAFAKIVSDQAHLIVAKMDGDRNSSPLPEDFSWPAYPTVLHVKAGERWPTVFHGNRTVANLVKFANEHGSQQIKLDPSVSSELEAEL